MLGQVGGQSKPGTWRHEQHGPIFRRAVQFGPLALEVDVPSTLARCARALPRCACPASSDSRNCMETYNRGKALATPPLQDWPARRTGHTAFQRHCQELDFAKLRADSRLKSSKVQYLVASFGGFVAVVSSWGICSSLGVGHDGLG